MVSEGIKIKNKSTLSSMVAGKPIGKHLLKIYP